MPARIKKNTGFTLVEVLVALTIFSVLMLTLFSSFNAFTSSGDMIKAHNQRRQNYGLALNIMADDLEQVFVLQPPRFQQASDKSGDTSKFQFTAGKEDINGASVSFLSFTSTNKVQFSNPYHNPPGITRITYYAVRHGEGIHIHRADSYPETYNENDFEKKCSAPVLFMDVQEFDLIFYDNKGNEHQTWDSGDEDFNFSLPSQIKIRVSKSDTPENIVETLVNIPVSRIIEE